MGGVESDGAPYAKRDKEVEDFSYYSPNLTQSEEGVHPIVKCRCQCHALPYAKLFFS